MKEVIQQIIVVRKDLIELTNSEIESLSNEKKDIYYKELEKFGKMNRGKIAAQASHASLGVILQKMRGSFENIEKSEKDYTISLDIKKDSDLCYWLENEFRKIILCCKNEESLLKLADSLKNNHIEYVIIKDKGYTSFNNKETITCIGIEPLKKTILDPFTKRLQILK